MELEKLIKLLREHKVDFILKYMKNAKLLIIYLIILCNICYARIVYLNWYWGVEKINKQDFLILNPAPKFEFNNLLFAFELPVEINSNWHIRKDDWNGSEDIVKKINYIEYKNSFLRFRLSALNNISFNEKFLIYNYSNELFEPILKKRGVFFNVNYNQFFSSLVIGNILDYDIIAAELAYRTEHIDTGMAIFYDSDIHNPYSDKPKDSNISAQRKYIDLNFSYIFKLSKFKISFQNDFVKNFSDSADTKNYIISTGPYININNLFTKIKFIYSKNETACIPVNYFYEIERNIFQTNYGIDTGYSFILGYNRKDFVVIGFDIQKSRTSNFYTGIEISTGKKFWTKFKTKLKIYNREVSELAEVLGDRNNNSSMDLEFTFPLSENLYFGILYIKSFIYNSEQNLLPLRVSMLKTEFRF